MSDLEQRAGALGQPPCPPQVSPVSRPDPAVLARILHALLAEQPVAEATGSAHGYRTG